MNDSPPGFSFQFYQFLTKNPSDAASFFATPVPPDSNDFYHRLNTTRMNYESSVAKLLEESEGRASRSMGILSKLTSESSFETWDEFWWDALKCSLTLRHPHYQSTPGLVQRIFAPISDEALAAELKSKAVELFGMYVSRIGSLLAEYQKPLERETYCEKKNSYEIDESPLEHRLYPHSAAPSHGTILQKIEEILKKISSLSELYPDIEDPGYKSVRASYDASVVVHREVCDFLKKEYRGVLEYNFNDRAINPELDTESTCIILFLKERNYLPQDYSLDDFYTYGQAYLGDALRRASGSI